MRFLALALIALAGRSAAQDSEPRLFLAPPVEPASPARLVLESGAPGGIMLLLAGPAGQDIREARRVLEVRLDQAGRYLADLPQGFGGLDLWALVNREDLLFGTSVSSRLPVPLPGEVFAKKSSQSGEVIITEIMKDPSAVSDTSGEWIEFYNTTSQPIDVEGWVISDMGSDATQLTNAGLGIMVPARGYAVVAKQTDAGLNGGVQAAGSYGSFTLSNGEDEVVLSLPGGYVVDQVNYDDGVLWPDVGGASLQLSTERLASTWNDLGENWCSSSTPFGVGDLGTPAARNEYCGG
ncbi:MAG: hypothetical protein ACI8QC_002402 [Planctomycetota bacterium]|jgi:hypothetical protein